MAVRVLVATSRGRGKSGGRRDEVRKSRRRMEEAVIREKRKEVEPEAVGCCWGRGMAVVAVIWVEAERESDESSGPWRRRGGDGLEGRIFGQASSGRRPREEVDVDHLQVNATVGDVTVDDGGGSGGGRAVEARVEEMDEEGAWGVKVEGGWVEMREGEGDVDGSVGVMEARAGGLAKAHGHGGDGKRWRRAEVEVFFGDGEDEADVEAKAAVLSGAI